MKIYPRWSIVSKPTREQPLLSLLAWVRQMIALRGSDYRGNGHGYIVEYEVSVACTIMHKSNIQELKNNVAYPHLPVAAIGFLRA